MVYLETSMVILRSHQRHESENQQNLVGLQLSTVREVFSVGEREKLL